MKTKEQIKRKMDKLIKEWEKLEALDKTSCASASRYVKINDIKSQLSALRWVINK